MSQKTDPRLKLLQKMTDSLPSRIINLLASLLALIAVVPLSEPRPPLGLPLPSDSFAGQNRPVASVPVAHVAPNSSARSDTTIPADYRVQSPNVSGVRRDIRIKYESAAVEIPKSFAGPTSAPPPPSAFSENVPVPRVQTSYRIQSPDVRDVGGNVDIQYGTEKSLRGKR